MLPETVVEKEDEPGLIEEIIVFLMGLRFLWEKERERRDVLVCWENGRGRRREFIGKVENRGGNGFVWGVTDKFRIQIFW